MFNRFLQLIFNLSIVIPYVLFIGIAKLFFRDNFKLGLFYLVLATLLIILQLFLIKIAKKRLTKKTINVTKISEDRETNVIITYITYAVPFFEEYIRKTVDTTSWFLIVGAVILIALSKKIRNNPVWLRLGYKVYSIETEHGVDYTLLSKREIRNTKSIVKIIRIFEYLIMEV